MIHTGQVLKLKPGCYDEYKKRHDKLWPELEEVMTTHGVDMVIFRFNDFLFLHGTAPTQQDWDAIANNPVTPKWNAHMAEVLETDEAGEIELHALPEAFSFGAWSTGA
ncbi:MAG: L-rhamnose mutarotase [Candidatus Latescibacteria bacterium]|jgi:L-rhamnose mutarotase|nr:L-rhamnose mutarotase [Candidatus Latescibacterota bacterium]